MNTQLVAKKLRRNNPTVTHFVIVVEEDDGCKVLSVKNANGDVLQQFGEGNGFDDVTWDDLYDWARALVVSLQVTAEFSI